jgi:hypothetical protein
MGRMKRESKSYSVGDLATFPRWAIDDVEFVFDGEEWQLESIGAIRAFRWGGGRHSLATAFSPTTIAALIEDPAFSEVLEREVAETWTP